MIKFSFKYYNRYLTFTNHLGIVLFVFFDFHEKIALDLLSYLYLFLLSPFFCNAINSDNIWNPRINHLYSVSKGKLLFMSNVVNIANTLFFFIIFLAVETFQYPNFDFTNSLYDFSIMLLIAVIAGNFISLKLSQYHNRIYYKFMLGILFMFLLSILFSLVQLFHFHPVIKIIALLFTVILIDFSQYKKTYYYYDFN